ncbi:tryptophan synthase beta subunit-like PLP-dependent enzyme [Leptodontidium sp. MPI-SDFR-AT-0119]|nr:tryptophan synthase beta subunit-like PLP-dependent enzyme [Leptodontidium sp. MPI-SDFR-AT-0119]
MTANSQPRDIASSDPSSYAPTPLTSLPSLAQDFGVAAVYLKDESQRFVREGAKQRKDGIMLVAATEGNHGRAVARIACMLGLQARILVPKYVGDDAETVSLIRNEGAEVVVTDFDYDRTDTAFDGYDEIPEWIVEGYSTMLSEIDRELEGKPPDLIVTLVGVGSLAQAIISYSKRSGRNTRVLAVEPDTAACLWTSLSNGTSTPVKTSSTIMASMNCGTLSTTAWPILKAGVDVSVTVSDIEAHQVVQKLFSLGVEAGPCGAATLAGLQYAASTDLNLTLESIIVLLSIEGARAYTAPLDVTISDPVTLAQALVRIDSTNLGLSKSGGAGETAIAEYITAWLSHRGIETHWLESTRGRPSVVGIIRGIGGGKALMLNGHIDTVTTAGYEGNPLSGVIHGGKIYGRGILDMKAGIAAALIALVAAKEANLRGDIIFAGVADEENLSLGTEEILAAGWTADGAIVMEPTMLDIVLSHKGFVWFKVDIYGRVAYGSLFDIGIDAICKAGYFLVELDKYNKSILDGKRDYLIQGGEEPSSYPAMCTVTIERRTVPGEAEETTLQELRSILERLTNTVPEFTYDIHTTFVRPAF